jgi:vacuolar-type H+-ATPase subunit C/Vma6
MTPTPKQSDFLKVAVKRDVKREIDIIAAIEGRSIHSVVADMLNCYKLANIETLKAAKLPRVTKKLAAMV